MIEYRQCPEGVIINVIVQPRASKAGIVGIHQDALKIKLTAPPAEGAANKQCIAVLAKALSIPKSTLEIIGGRTSRRKQLIIRSRTGRMDKTEIQALKTKLNQLGE